MDCRLENAQLKFGIDKRPTYNINVSCQKSSIANKQQQQKPVVRHQQKTASIICSQRCVLFMKSLSLKAHRGKL